MLNQLYDKHCQKLWSDYVMPSSETTQIENPRTQWRQEQERMLKEYLVVAQEALKAKKEMYLVKQQRLELAKQEMLLFHELSEDNHSITSSKTHQCSASVPPQANLLHVVDYTHTLLCPMDRENESKGEVLTWSLHDHKNLTLADLIIWLEHAVSLKSPQELVGDADL